MAEAIKEQTRTVTGASQKPKQTYLERAKKKTLEQVLEKTPAKVIKPVAQPKERNSYSPETADYIPFLGVFTYRKRQLANNTWNEWSQLRAAALTFYSITAPTIALSLYCGRKQIPADINNAIQIGGEICTHALNYLVKITS